MKAAFRTHCVNPPFVVKCEIAKFVPLYCDKYFSISQGILIPIYMCHLSQVVQAFHQIQLPPLEAAFQVISACAHRRNNRQAFKTPLPGDRLGALDQLGTQAGMLGSPVFSAPISSDCP